MGMKTSGVAPRDHPPFANSDDGYAWQSNWRDRCIHNQPAREGRYEDACGIWYIAECGQTPGEWLRSPASGTATSTTASSSVAKTTARSRRPTRSPLRPVRANSYRWSTTSE